MNLKDFKNTNKYNLFVVNDEDAWEGDSYLFPRERIFTTFTSKDIKTTYRLDDQKSIEQIMTYPCMFLYEEQTNKNGYLGYLKSIKVRSKMVKVYFEKIGKISLNDLKKHAFDLDISMPKGITELMHTHWTIKDVNLYDEINSLDVVDDTSLVIKPKVFVSYCWKPRETKERVHELISKLENDGIEVIYDKKSLLPGQDINAFMERICKDTEIKKVLVICTKIYADKADSRNGGVGVESEIIIPQVYQKPLQNKIIPVHFEKDEKGVPYVPIYLKSRFGIDLTVDNEKEGYEELLKDIFR